MQLSDEYEYLFAAAPETTIRIQILPVAKSAVLERSSYPSRRDRTVGIPNNILSCGIDCQQRVPESRALAPKGSVLSHILKLTDVEMSLKTHDNEDVAVRVVLRDDLQ